MCLFEGKCNVILASFIIGAGIIGSDISPNKILLTVSDGVGELSSEHWQLTQVDIMTIS